MLGVNVATCLAGTFCAAPRRPFRGSASPQQSHPASYTKSNPAARIGLSLAYMDFLSPGHPDRVNVPGLMLRLPRHPSFEPVRLLAPGLSRFRMGPIIACNPLLTPWAAVPHLCVCRHSPSGLSSLRIGNPCGPLSCSAETLARKLTVAKRPISLRSPALILVKRQIIVPSPLHSARLRCSACQIGRAHV